MNIETRIRMAVESLLENESLREGLDNSGGSTLLAWGTDCAKRIAGNTASIEDDEEANESMYPHMKALRKLLRAVKDLYQENTDATQRNVCLQEISDTLINIYGPEITPPHIIRLNVFVAMQAGDTGQKIQALRNFIEQQITPYQGE